MKTTHDFLLKKVDYCSKLFKCLIISVLSSHILVNLLLISQLIGMKTLYNSYTWSAIHYY